MKNAIVIALICINAALLAAIMLGEPPKAQAQVRTGSDYVAVTSRFYSDDDAIFVIDLSTRRMAAWSFNKTTKRLEPFRGRDLQRDFRMGR